MQKFTCRPQRRPAPMSRSSSSNSRTTAQTDQQHSSYGYEGRLYSPVWCHITLFRPWYRLLV